MIKFHNKLSSFRITAYHDQSILNFFKTLSLFCKKSRIFLYCKNKKINCKKHTILRSPHVNKKARDQIQIKNIIYTFYTKGSERNWLYFLMLLKFKSTSVLHFDYQHVFFQNLTYLYPHSNEKLEYILSLNLKNRVNWYIASLNEL